MTAVFRENPASPIPDVVREFRVGDGRYRVENRADELGIAVLTVSYIACTGRVIPVGKLMIPLAHLPGLRHAILNVLRQTQQDRVQNSSPSNGLRWSHEEDSTLLSAFDDGSTVSELAEQHRRTEGAIETRLVKLGRLKRSPGRRSGR